MEYHRLYGLVTFREHAHLRIRERIKDFNRNNKSKISINSVKADIIGHLHKRKGLIYPSKRFKMETIENGFKYYVEYVAVDQNYTRQVITFWVSDYKVKNKKEIKVEKRSDRKANVENTLSNGRTKFKMENSQENTHDLGSSKNY